MSDFRGVNFWKWKGGTPMLNLWIWTPVSLCNTIGPLLKFKTIGVSQHPQKYTNWHRCQTYEACLDTKSSEIIFRDACAVHIFALLASRAKSRAQGPLTSKAKMRTVHASCNIISEYFISEQAPGLSLQNSWIRGGGKYFWVGGQKFQRGPLAFTGPPP